MSSILAGAANRIESGGWASRHQQPGVPLSDAIALEVRDAPGTNAKRAALLAAAFAALEQHVSAACFPDWLRDPDRTQAEIVAALRGAAESAHEERRSL
ncbi:DUF6197 family protein [Nonomuraea gerenzanensis]|uniref:DUF6197 family protein n=1 Tax=Nonomuraea gerenzanensis TaxID=93944 RepID=UPI001CDA238B|nr:hypothetical protein [Nonomuraea gerenzanensis]UBU16616.1 hypothetical protein LCN96_16845 [Nonomuraea gerenzanensis]